MKKEAKTVSLKELERALELTNDTNEMKLSGTIMFIYTPRPEDENQELVRLRVHGTQKFIIPGTLTTRERSVTLPCRIEGPTTELFKTVGKGSTIAVSGPLYQRTEKYFSKKLNKEVENFVTGIWVNHFKLGNVVQRKTESAAETKAAIATELALAAEGWDPSAIE